MMKKLIALMLLVAPLTLWAQDNTWEQPEEDAQEVKKEKENPDAKYLRGAVPEEDGRVVFSKTVEAPGKPAAEIYGIIKGYMEKMTGEKNQLNSHIVVDEPEKYEVAGSFEEWLVFKSNYIMLDRTRFFYVFYAKCADGKAELTINRIHYFYDEGRRAERYNAEDWITDKEAVNKKNTRLYPVTGKFRRKTIDRKDFLFNKIEALLK